MSSATICEAANTVSGLCKEVVGICGYMCTGVELCCPLLNSLPSHSCMITWRGTLCWLAGGHHDMRCCNLQLVCLCRRHIWLLDNIRLSNYLLGSMIHVIDVLRRVGACEKRLEVKGCWYGGGIHCLPRMLRTLDHQRHIRCAEVLVSCSQVEFPGFGVGICL